MPDELLNLTEAGAITRLGRDAIGRRIDRGQLDPTWIGRRRLVTREALERAGLLDEGDARFDTSATAPAPASALETVPGPEAHLPATPDRHDEQADDEPDDPPRPRGPLGQFIDGFMGRC